MGGMQKMVVAALAQIGTIAAHLGLNMDWATPEIVSTIGGVITIALVYFVPNKSR